MLRDAETERQDMQSLNAGDEKVKWCFKCQWRVGGFTIAGVASQDLVLLRIRDGSSRGQFRSLHDHA